jgi:hypothetical protein
MVSNNFTTQTMTQQLAQRSGQVAIRQSQGGLQFVDQLTGQQLDGISAASSILANPQTPNDPRITARALDLARGHFTDNTVPIALVEALATVAAYISVTQGIPVDRLINNNTLSLGLIYEYNRFKPKGSQVGVFTNNLTPAWSNNPVLRGSISAALTDEP